MNQLKYRKTTLLFAVSLFVLLCSSCAAPSGETTETVVIQDKSNTVTALISEESPEQNPRDMATDLSTMTISKSAAGLQEALVRCPLPAAIVADDVVYASLYLKRSSGDDPSLQAGLATQNWFFSDVTWAYMVGATQMKDGVVSEFAGDDWYAIDATSIVTAWLSGDYANRGFVIAETENGKSTAFYSGDGDEPANYPKLEVTYKPNESGRSYGKYDYTAQDDGNCLSYSLRDTGAIFYDDLVADTEAFQKIYDEGGTGAALSYFKALCFDYIEQNRETLQIESIRELSGFDAKIDPAKEYRVALRIGFRDHSLPEGIQVEQDFDYHLRVQLTDGSWAEKTPGESSRIAPGSNAALDPGTYPWDESFMWGYEKWNDFYTSDTVYFAVTKSTDSFTFHSDASKDI